MFCISNANNVFIIYLMKRITKPSEESNNKTKEVARNMNDKVKDQSQLEYYAKMMICDPWLYLKIINQKVF